MPSEGKTTVAVNLATAFAQVEEKTLIIDADLRNPKLHYLFNLKRGNGVTEVLSMEQCRYETVYLSNPGAEPFNFKLRGPAA